MKRLFIAAATAAIIGISTGAEILPQCKPWQSRGLNQVKLGIGADELKLTENGKAAATIVIPASGENLQYYQAIAELLKKYLDLSTGAAFNIVRGDLPDGKGIFIGPCQQAEVKQGFADAQKMPEESFAVKSFSRGIMLVGNDRGAVVGRNSGTLNLRNAYWSKGTFFAAVDFLQRMIGCRFYFPGRLGTVTADFKNKTLIIPGISYTDKPVFSFRASSYDHHGFTDDAEAETGSIKERSEWGSIMRLGDVHNQITSHTDNNWNKLFAKSHPEYFALREDGSRMIGDHGAQSVQRCYSSASGLQAQLDEIEKYYKDGKDYTAFASQNVAPDQKYIRWWPNDGFNGCHCESCMKLTDPQAPFSRRHSRLIWDYISRLAKECKQRWPDKKLLVPAYSTFRVIPDDVVVPDNVEIIPVLPGNGFSLAYLKEPACQELSKADIIRLQKLNSGKVWMWMHYPHRPRISSQLHTPYPAPHIMKDFVKSNQNVFSGFYLNGHKTTVLALDSVMLYLWFQMLWDPGIDVDAVSDEYCNLMFGPAAETMKQYFAILTDRWENTRWKIKLDYANASNFLEALIPQSCYFGETYPRKVRDELEIKLNKALKETPADSIYHQRMNWMIAGTKKFFVQGKFYDSGNSIKTTAAALSPVIDGELNDWNNVPALQLADNTSGQKVELQTNIKTAFDSSNLYISGVVSAPGGKFDTPGEKQSRDCPLWRKDNIELFICAETRGLAESGFPQNAQFHHIIFNADGSVYDAYKPVDGKEDSNINIDLDLVTKRTPDGFVFEMKIPFKSINAIPPEPGKTWPVNIYRTHSDSTGAKYYAWSPTLGSFHDTSRFGLLEFPRKAMWTMDLKPLKDGASPFIMPDVPAGVERNISFKDGQMVVKCKASPDLKEKFELIFYAKDGVRPDISNRQKPLTLRLEAGMQGKGIFRLRCGSALLRSKEGGLGQFYWTRIPAGQEINGNAILQSDCNSKKQPVHSVNTAVFAIQAEPGAEFTVTVKKMEIFD
jgi:hypothetical protein